MRDERYNNLAEQGTPYAPLADPTGVAVAVCACDVDVDGREEIYFVNAEAIFGDRPTFGDRLFKWQNNSSFGYQDLLGSVWNQHLHGNYPGRSAVCLDLLGNGWYSVVVATYSFYGVSEFAVIEMDDSHPENDPQSRLIILRDVAYPPTVVTA
uniref:FG-GAP repeat protein n=1 Tax=Trichuris muris TaxID=70415 RepID=A0A5S6R3I9_TRIMR